MSKQQIFKVSCVNLKDKTITLELDTGPTQQDGSGNQVWPIPWIGAIGKEYRLLPDGTLKEVVEEW